MAPPDRPRLTRKLVEACVRGERNAIGELYTLLHSPRHQVRRIIAHPSWRFGPDQEDVFQEVFTGEIIPALSSFQAPEEADPVVALEKYLSHITRRACISLWRKRQAQMRGAAYRHVDFQAVEERFLFEVQTHEEAVYQEELRGILYASIQELRPHCREVIGLRLEGLTLRQIAERLAIPEKTAGSRLARCLEQLRKHLLARYGDSL
jgi:RNA polymerase sigma factor (sigma-70 family)